MLLQEAGLGLKSLCLTKDSQPQTLKKSLEDAFPKLAEGGGFELLRKDPTTPKTLRLIQVPKSGYTSTFLADESGVNQATCYIRPIQTFLNLEMPTNEVNRSITLHCFKH